MLLGRAALRCDQIVETVPREEVQTFDPDRLLRNIDAAIDDLRSLADHLSPSPVKLLHSDRAVPFIARHLVRHAVVDDVSSVAFPEDRRIDAFETQPDRSTTVQPGSLP
jgi:hypothetical protein